MTYKLHKFKKKTYKCKLQNACCKNRAIRFLETAINEVQLSESGEEIGGMQNKFVS